MMTDTVAIMMQSPPGAEAVIDGRKCLYFAGTAYLALQSHPLVIQAGCQAMQRYGVGAATTRAGFGNQPPTIDVELAAAQYFDQPAAFYFPSGYMAPAALLAALASSADVAFADEHAHFAVHDALRAIGKPWFTFAHRDVDDLGRRLRSETRAGDRVLVFSDGVFAATGRTAPVDQYIDLLRRHRDSMLCLDDAHGVGVLGEQGRGTFEHFGSPAAIINRSRSSAGPPKLFACATLSKALGGYGGIIAGDEAFIANVRSASRLYDGCSAPPAALAAASAAAINLLIEDPSPRHRLTHNARYLHQCLHRIGLDVENVPTPVVSIDLGEATSMRRIHDRLLNQNIAIGYLAYPGTQPRGALRIAVSAAHTTEMIDFLIGRLRETL